MTRRQRTICALAARAGIDSPRVIHSGGRHPKLVGMVGGRMIRTPVPGSPSDYRALRNLKAQLRRAVKEMA